VDCVRGNRMNIDWDLLSTILLTVTAQRLADSVEAARMRPPRYQASGQAHVNPKHQKHFLPWSQ
jgi:hypothetical protein